MGAASTMRVRALEKLAAACYRRVNGRHARDVTRGIVEGADASSSSSSRHPRQLTSTTTRSLSTTPTPAPSIIVNHPKRFEAASILHARPWNRLEVPSLVSAITCTHKTVELVDGVECPLAHPRGATRNPAVAYDADYDHLAKLCEHFGAAIPPRGVSFHSCHLTPHLTLRWERHTEAQTYQLTREGGADGGLGPETLDAPFDARNVAVSFVPGEWVATIPGRVICATHLVVTDDVMDHGAESAKRARSTSVLNPNSSSSAAEDDAEAHEASGAIIEDLRRLFGSSEHDVITGCELEKGRFRCFSDWRSHGDGFNRVVIRHQKDDARAFVRTSAGKAAQRMVELDKYRMLALMAMPFAQGIARRVDALNDELKDVAEKVDVIESMDEDDKRNLLTRLTRLAVAGQRLSAIAHDRFNASNAYASIVEDRLEYMRAGRITGVPSMNTFLDAAMKPALRTFNATQRRLDKVAMSSQLTAEIIRTRLTLEQHAQSNENLRELKKTSSTQLMMQHNVEGLSAVAITYYSLGVLGYLLKAASATPYAPPVPTELALGGAIPIIWGAVTVAISRMKRAAAIEGGAEKH